MGCTIQRDHARDGNWMSGVENQLRRNDEHPCTGYCVKGDPT